MNNNVNANVDLRNMGNDSESEADTLPPLPKIEGDVDLTLSVFTHSSVQDQTGSRYDSARLAELGEQVLDLAVTNHFFSKQPALSADALRVERMRILADEAVDQWVDSYALKTKLRVAPGTDPRSDVREMKRYFLTYVGAVFISNGMPTVEQWVSQLIEPGSTPPQHLDFSHTTANDDPYAQQPLPPQYYSPQAFPQGHAGLSGLPPTQSPPPPPPGNPPPLPGYGPGPSGSSSSSTSNMHMNMNSTMNSTSASGLPPWLTLAMINQTASQRHASITYQAENMVGPPHAPTWTVHCYINNEERGRGVGKTMKLAKEDAAKHAYVAMGWLNS